MKTRAIITLSLLTIVGCTEHSLEGDLDTTPARNRVEISISATQNSLEDTRIEFNNGSIYDMLWEADDHIGLYVAGTGEKATFTTRELGDNRKSARFGGEIYEPEAIDSYYAYYPANMPFNGSTVSFVLPHEYNGEGASEPYLVASHENVERHHVKMSFRPVTALLELNLGFAADKVTIESVNGESLSGVYAYNFASGTIQHPVGKSSITLNSPSVGIHYIYMPEVTLAKGYKVTVTIGDKQMIKSVGYGKEKEFVAGEVSTLAIPTFEGVAVDMCSVYTSYTLYKQGNTQANSVDAGTIYFEGNCSYAGISSTLVKECGVNINGTNITATASNKQFSIDNQTNQGQGTYKVYAYVKAIDGTVYKSAEQTLYITGLPYSINCKSVAIGDASGWSTTGTVTDYYGWRFAYWYILGKDTKFGELYSPTFYAPESINVTYTATVCYYTSGVGGSSRTLYSGVTTGTTPANTFSDTLSRKTSNWTPGDGSFTDYPHSTILPKGNQYRIYIADQHSKDGNAAWNGISIRAFTVDYTF